MSSKAAALLLLLLAVAGGACPAAAFMRVCGTRFCDEACMDFSFVGANT